MFDLLSFFKYIILILFRKKKIHSLFYESLRIKFYESEWNFVFVKCIMDNNAEGSF